jgi:fumarate reductase iron-sulfur subunit
MNPIEREVEVVVMRYLPEQGGPPFERSYRVPAGDDTTVLQALQYIKDGIDGTLSFRWSCRMAICGSCGMMIDGVPKLACQTLLRDCGDRIRVEALDHFPVERDLVVDMGDFVGKLERIKPYLINDTPRSLAEGPHRQTPEQLEAYEQYSSCINCMLCYAACPQYGLNPRFLGPAATALLHRYNEDSRDAGKAQRMQQAYDEDGVFNCTAVGYCSEVCPKKVDPANAVNINKMESAKAYFTRFANPKDKNT